jgi:hypothetical protein
MGLSVRLQCLGNFYDFQIYFSVGKLVDRIDGPEDWIRGLSPPRLVTPLVSL